MFIDGIYSHYQYVKSRILQVNPDRIVKGHVMAMDWPPKNYTPDAFYLVVQGETPIGRQGFSPYIPIVYHEFTWTWITSGQDIGAGQVGPNRGSRFQTHMSMQGEIEQALSPYFCEKMSWGFDNSTPPNWVGTSLSPIEYIGWAPPSYHARLDKTSGKVYGSVMVKVWDMLDPVTT
jgi:hypothetical protein